MRKKYKFQFGLRLVTSRKVRESERIFFSLVNKSDLLLLRKKRSLNKKLALWIIIIITSFRRD